MKMTQILLLGLLTTISAASAWAGGPHCGPGYCMNYDGNGCHPCGVGFGRVTSDEKNTNEQNSSVDAEPTCLDSVLESVFVQ